MIVIFYLLCLSLVLGGCGLAAFLWALKQGQFNDLEGDAQRILFEDDVK